MIRTKPMTAIRITKYAHRLNTRFPGIRVSRSEEIWSANSLTGEWTYERSDEPGTPWVVTHTPTGHVEYFGSLPKARRWTMSDSAYSHMLLCLRAETGDKPGSRVVALVAIVALSA